MWPWCSCWCRCVMTQPKPWCSYRCQYAVASRSHGILTGVITQPKPCCSCRCQCVVAQPKSWHFAGVSVLWHSPNQVHCPSLTCPQVGTHKNMNFDNSNNILYVHYSATNFRYCRIPFSTVGACNIHTQNCFFCKNVFTT